MCATTGLIVARTMRTIDASMDPLIRMSKLPENQQMDFYCSNLMGANWQEQVQQVSSQCCAAP